MRAFFLASHSLEQETRTSCNRGMSNALYYGFLREQNYCLSPVCFRSPLKRRVNVSNHPRHRPCSFVSSPITHY